ncbi:hypothetical protein B0H67DRAFT_601996 [Lasiosphaeris hirsuta]|uniref:Proteophosphoglycan 5 n=1 Tax=Lasiosphaeris hirsuta TaxID=260670 RepID=A0AA40A8A4_9PEZI|nr:hypothetical protein B0H67DRAFT_601996 [Lasiosphaeris hirsuta]
MQQYPNPPKGTPGRRRANRHSVNSPARKTYASENDMSTAVPFPIDFAIASPYTPQKPLAHSPAPASQANNTRSKPRSGNKSRPKQVSTSPGPAKTGRSTPPQTAPPKTITAAAFAGATFHASPAPSSLPIPSFLAKAMDSPGLKGPGRVSQEPSPPATDSEAPTPRNRHLTMDIAREESPLDFFFRIDRAEKERARRASSAQVSAPNPGPLSPPTQLRSPQEPRTLPNGVGAHRRRPSTQRNSYTGISSTELDGTPGRPIGPSFSTPYQDRIRASRSSEKQAEPAQKAAPQPQSQQLPHQQQQSSNDDLSERLKKFLAVPVAQYNSQPPVHVAPVPAAAPKQDWSISGAQQVSISSSTSHGVDQSRPPELLHMEDSLRRMLKINSGSNLGAAPSTSYRSS